MLTAECWLLIANHSFILAEAAFVRAFRPLVTFL